MKCKIYRLCYSSDAIHTFTLQTLSHDTIDKRTAVITECESHEIVNSKTMWNVDVESLSCQLHAARTTTSVTYQATESHSNTTSNVSLIDVAVLL